MANNETKWQVTQGTSRAVVVAATHAEAERRASEIGFKAPDSIVSLFHQCSNEHEALGMCLGMLERIAEGKNYDASEYHARLAEAKRHYEREQRLIAIDLYNPRRLPHAYLENDLGTDGCGVCGKAKMYKLHREGK